MNTIAFEGLGTVWKILVDSSNFSEFHKKKLLNLVKSYENKYSRFKETSEVSKINNSESPTKISPDLQNMLVLGNQLCQLTEGYFSLNINSLISGYGYDNTLSFKRDQQQISRPRGTYSIKKNILYKHGEVEIDLGGIGKGYLIDKIANLLVSYDYKFFLIDGGGDIYATTKKDGSAWQVAVEHPLDQTLAINTIQLSNQSLATSSSQKRKHEDFHHLLNPKTNLPVQSILSVSVLSSSATLADSGATAIFVSPKEYWGNISKHQNLEYFVVLSDLTYVHSNHFPPPSW